MIDSYCRYTQNTHVYQYIKESKVIDTVMEY